MFIREGGISVSITTSFVYKDCSWFELVCSEFDKWYQATLRGIEQLYLNYIEFTVKVGKKICWITFEINLLDS